MEEKYKMQNIERLDISCKVIEQLKNNKITKIGQLCNKTKTNLREMKLMSNEINKIEVELQLLGLNLKGAL